MNASTYVRNARIRRLSFDALESRFVLASISASDSFAAEGHLNEWPFVGAGTQTTQDVKAYVPVRLSSISTSIITVDYTTVSLAATPTSSPDIGYAIAPGDYVTKSGTLTFLPGDTLETIEITVKTDNVLDGALFEIFGLQLSNPANATLFDSLAVITILDGNRHSSGLYTPSWVPFGSEVLVTGTSDLDITAELGRPLDPNDFGPTPIPGGGLGEADAQAQGNHGAYLRLANTGRRPNLILTHNVQSWDSYTQQVDDQTGYYDSFGLSLF